ncbi:hypothetical protein BGZ68_008539 [Mortierella alpina]|nr:hypothetical protein BGZ68_008539 [Mortierella alpina]
MVQIDNKSVVFLNQPTDYPIADEHLGVKNEKLTVDLKNGQILLRNLFVSYDPYLRGRMNGLKKSYVPSFEIGHPFDSYGIAVVADSKSSKYPVGAVVTGPIVRWEEHSVVDESLPLTIIPRDSQHPNIPLSAHIGVLGMPGLTAYGSLLSIGKPKAGETIFISAASGAVGQLVGQIAKLKGLRVIGSAGSDDKVDFLLNELKFDAAFNYRKAGTTILESLRAAAPEGIDIYYENVGGETLDAALDVIKNYGRIIVCGMISQYTTSKPYLLKNSINILLKQLTIQGFLVTDFSPEINEQFTKDVTEWLSKGEIVYKEDIADGLDLAPKKFEGLFHGANFGKGVIKIANL